MTGALIKRRFAQKNTQEEHHVIIEAVFQVMMHLQAKELWGFLATTKLERGKKDPSLEKAWPLLTFDLGLLASTTMK